MIVPVFCAYVLSFIYVGIYWNNHHHMFHTVQKVNGATLWANGGGCLASGILVA